MWPLHEASIGLLLAAGCFIADQRLKKSQAVPNEILISALDVTWLGDSWVAPRDPVSGRGPQHGADQQVGGLADVSASGAVVQPSAPRPWCSIDYASDRARALGRIGTDRECCAARVGV